MSLRLAKIRKTKYLIKRVAHDKQRQNEFEQRQNEFEQRQNEFEQQINELEHQVQYIAEFNYPQPNWDDDDEP